MKICVIGTGYVGLVAGAGFADTGNNVCCVDIDQNKIDLLNKGTIPIFEPGLEQLVAGNMEAGRLSFSTQIGDAVRESEVIFLAVGTPEKEDGSADLSYVRNAAATIGENLDSYKVIVCKSTVPVGTNEMIMEVISSISDMEFTVVSNPEFLKEGDAVNDFMKPDRVIIGTMDERARRIMKRLYKPLQRTKERIIFMDPRSAELTKYVANAYLATRITFVNEVANLCDLLGADVSKVRIGAGTDSRIGLRYFFPGCGYGGSCFPKDVQALMHTARSVGMKLEILETVDRINELQKLVPFVKLKKHFNNDFAGKRVALWGLSFKPETDDIREAPAVSITEELLKEGASVNVYDPVSVENFREVFGNRITYCFEQYETVRDVDALIVVTEWKELRSPDFDRLKSLMRTPVIVDGRNVYADYGLEDEGFSYYGIGLGNMNQNN